MTAPGRGEHDVDVSVIIPVRDGAASIGQQLDAVRAQQLDGSWEVVVADNGSSDETPAIVTRHAAVDGRLSLVDAGAVTGAGHARNAGAAAARGSKLAFCDADDLVGPGWLAAIVTGLSAADVVAGISASDRGSESEISARRPPRMAPFIGVPGANFGVRRDVYSALGGMDEMFLRAQDLEFGVRAQRAGYRVQLVRAATIRRARRPTLRGVARQQYEYGYWERAVAVRHAAALDPPRRFADLRAWGWVVVRAPYLLAGRFRRTLVVGKAAKQLGWARGRRHAQAFAPQADRG